MTAKPIPGCENYTINTKGQVTNTCTGAVLTPSTVGGYPYVNMSRDGRKVGGYIHRLLAQAFLENPESLPQVDHIDRDRSNYTLDNLRWVSSRTNNLNRSKRANTSSQYMGVNYHKRHNKWQAIIKADGRQLWLGLYDTEVEAALAYNKAAVAHGILHINHIPSEN